MKVIFEEFLKTLKQGTACKCPKCYKGDLYKSRFDLSLADRCLVCGLDYSKNDSADGPAVFLIFILGFTVVPLALWVDSAFSVPLWLHFILWTSLVLGSILGTLKPLKSYIIFLQYKYYPKDWDE
ncbi:MAG: DUF983 domain-containing protein [Pseudomonadota bacterium]